MFGNSVSFEAYMMETGMCSTLVHFAWKFIVSFNLVCTEDLFQFCQGTAKWPPSMQE